MKKIKAFLMSKYLLPLAIGFSLVISVTLTLFVGYSLITESYENDSMPILLSSKMLMTRLKKYPTTDFIIPESCLSDARMQTYLQQNYPSSEMKWITCDSFSIAAQQKLYYLKGGSLSVKQSFFLVSGDQPLEMVIQVGGEYPGNRVEDVKGDGSAVFFTFEGWNNPRKVIELQAVNR